MNSVTSLLITLSCEVALVVGVGLVAERLLPAVRHRRRLWCAVLIGVGLLAAVELAGLRVVVRRWASLGSLGTPRPSEPRWVITEVTGTARPMEVGSSYSVQKPSEPIDLPAPSHWPSLLVASWLFGTVTIWLRSGYQRWKLQRVVRQSCRWEVSPAREIARQLGLDPERIQLCEAAGFLGPVAFGVFRPTVLLPCGFVHRYGDLELKVLLAHELAHLAARDPLWLAISDFLSGLLWWHPAVWWSRRRLRATSEAAADDASSLIPGGRIALAEALVAFGNQLAGETSPAGFGVGGLKSDLATRVTRLLTAPVRASSRLMTRATVAGTVSALLAIAMAPWPGEGAQPVVTTALESIGSLASKPPRATKVTAEAKSESGRSASRVPGFEPSPSDSDRQPPSPRESLQSRESKPAIGGNQVSPEVDSMPPTSLEEVIVPRFEIAEGPLQDLAQRLQQTLRDADPHKRNLRITVANQDLRIGLPMLQLDPVPAAILLEDVAKTCTVPVEWALHDNEIVFRKIASGKWPMHTQSYHVGSMKLLAHIRGRLEKAGETPSDKNIQNEVRAFLSEHGAVFPKTIDLAPGAPDLAAQEEVTGEQDERACFLSRDGGTLFVRTSIPDQKRIHLALLEYAASTMPPTQTPVLTNALGAVSTKAKPADLGLIEQALVPMLQHTLSTGKQGASFVDSLLGAVSDSTLSPPLAVPAKPVAPGDTSAEPRRLEVQIRLAEVRESKVRGLGLDWIFGNSTNQETKVDATWAKEREPLAAILLDHRFRVDQAQTVGEQVELTPEQSKALLRSLQMDGFTVTSVDLLTMPKILTQLGRKARVDHTQTRSVFVGPTELGDKRNKASMRYGTSTVKTGPLVEFLPTLDGDSVRLQVTATVTEFLGYDDPTDRDGKAVATVTTPSKGAVALPHFRIRRAMADATCSLGGTVVIRGPLVTEMVRTKDQVPLLGDVPVLGRFFRSESSNTHQNRLYIFLTPEEVDMTNPQVPPPVIRPQVNRINTVNDLLADPQFRTVIDKLNNASK